MLNRVADWCKKILMAPSHLATPWRRLLCLRSAWAEATRAWSSDQVDRPHVPPPQVKSPFSLAIPASRATLPFGYEHRVPLSLQLCPCYAQLCSWRANSFQVFTRSVVFYSPRAQLFSPLYSFTILLAAGLAIHFDIWLASGL